MALQRIQSQGSFPAEDAPVRRGVVVATDELHVGDWVVVEVLTPRGCNGVPDKLV